MTKPKTLDQLRAERFRQGSVKSYAQNCLQAPAE